MDSPRNPDKGEFNFKNDKHFNLDIAKFIEMAHDLGLMVNLRPGPYICAEWEWGGHPYWLLHDPKMEVRTTYPGYLTAVRRFYEALFDEVKDLMYEKGGPIVMVQIENEYAGYGQAVDPEVHRFPIISQLNGSREHICKPKSVSSMASRLDYRNGC